MLRWLRRYPTSPPIVFLIAIALTFAGAKSACAQPPSPTTEAPATPATPAISLEQIDAESKLVEESAELDDATKAQLKDLLAQARTAATQAEAAQKNTEQYRSWIDSAANDLENARSQLKKSPEGFDFDQAESWDLSQLVTKSALLNKRLEDARTQLTQAQAEPVRRSTRTAEISNEIAAARAELATVETELKSLPSDGAPSVPQRVRELHLHARQQAAHATIESLENERIAYEAQGDFPRLRSEIAEALVARLAKDARFLNQLIAERREGDTQAQKEETLAALESAPELLKPYAQKAVDRADQRIQRAKDLQLVTPQCTEIAEALQSWRDDFKRTRSRTENGASATLGLVLLQKQTSLPDASQHREEIATRVNKIRSLQGELLEQEDRLAQLSDVEAAAGAAIAKLRDKKKPIPANAGDQLAEVYLLERRILNDLHDDTERYFGRLVAANEDQEALANQLEAYDDFVRERIFWIRSISPLAIADLSNAVNAFAWLATPQNWQEMADTLRTTYPPRSRHVFAAACIAFLFLFRRRMRRKVRELGKIASAPLCRNFAPTLQVLPLTLLLAATIPALIGLAAEIVDNVPTEFPLAVSSALMAVAIAWLSALTTVEVCRSGGLAEAHLGWSPRALAVVRSNLRLLLLLGTPLLFFVVLFVHQGNPLYRASAARLFHVAFMTLAVFFLHRVFRPHTGILENVDPKGAYGWLNRYRAAVHVGLVLLPAMVALLSSLGFDYAARQLSTDFLRSFELIFCLFIAEGVLCRWVRVKRRQIRWQQLMDARQRQTTGEQAPQDDLTTLVAEEETVDLGEIDQQTRRLIRSSISIIGLLGLWSIWSGVLPALSYLDNYELWNVKTADGATQLVSIGDLALAALVAVFTFVAARNIPGLIEIVLLDRLPLESSLRYAVSTLCQYAIVIVGSLAVFHSIGIRWENAQWLVAALSVGLGFGLQEVVANFICGILLLFERPIRVGDIVTLGDTTGVVVRIRSRATTVRNWDRQEVVVPNKELITGRIINWTLSDQWNRIVLNVGIAYGSDTRRARDVLAEILQQHPSVLDDPQPVITFEQFGDSTLNFVIRAILSDMNERLNTIHDLHTLINDRFAEEGIEIAFPQQDLHIRSVDPSITISDGSNKAKERSVKQPSHD